MLVEFSVENFRVFREKQTFSMVNPKPSDDAIFFERTIGTGFSAAPSVNRLACLFGANGAGKTSLVEAMTYMSDFVKNSVVDMNPAGIRLAPFIFCDEWRKKPTIFEIAFICENTLYQYGFEISSERVEEEWLFARPISTGRARQLFYRSYDASTKEYEWHLNSTHIKGERGYWRTQTRQDALFLSVAVQFNGGILREPYDWITKKLKFLPRIDLGSKSNTATRLKNEDRKEDFLRLMRLWGVLVDDIVVQEVDHDFSTGSKSVESFIHDREKYGRRLTKGKDYAVDFVRTTDDNKRVAIPVELESRGTQVLFGLICPILDALENGCTVVADDFCNDLHPLALRKLPAMFTDNKTNRRNAQLIFTTHDVTVTDHSSVGNDGIWLLQKKSKYATEVYPYQMFREQKEGTFSKKYLYGDYGAIPVVVC